MAQDQESSKVMTDDNKQIIEENEEFPKEVDEFIDGLIEEGYDIEDIEAVLTDDDFLAKLDDLDAEYEDEEGELDEMKFEVIGGDNEAQRKAVEKHIKRGAEKRGIKLEVDKTKKKPTKEETETMMKDISKGKLGFGQVTPILANAAYCAIKRMPEDERAGVIEDVWDDQDAFRLLITSQN